MVDEETTKNLDLLIHSPAFVLRQLEEGVAELVKLDSIPVDGHAYLVAGESTLPDGTKIPSVFVVENGGGSLRKTYWQVDGEWYEPPELEGAEVLGVELFPYDWATAVPLDNDARD
ncbi:MAG: hypothetical protein ACYTHK_17700 [Planctomycetota bacterium]|jgi:hypothetical protein